MASEIAPEAIGEDEWLSQYGTIHKPIAGKPFKCCPTFGQTDISMMRGRRIVGEMARSVNRKRSDGAIPGEGVRRVLASTLRDAGFLATGRRGALNDLIEITIGARPWLPSDGTESVAEFDRYDFPTCGLVRQGDDLFIFDCVEGHLMEGNVWMYARVSPEEARELQAATGEDLVRAIDAVFESRPLMGVLAINGRVRSGSPVTAQSVAEKGVEQALLDELDKGRAVAKKTAGALKHLVDV